MDIAIEMRGIVKVFGDVIANDHVNLKINKGQIHGIIGENGAGKSTLMKQLYGMYKPDAGKIFIYGEPVELESPKDAIALQIGMVHQHFTLVPSMTVLENIILGQPPIKNGLVDYSLAKKQVRETCEKYKFDLKLNERIETQPVGIRQRVEIIKAMHRGADVLILDEPTSVLTPQEILGLFDMLREIKAMGKSIILITHKLSEILAVTEKVTVLRDGKVTGTIKTHETNETELAKLMVEREVLLRVKKTNVKLGPIIFEVRNLACKNNDGITVIDDVSFQVRQGEILGIAGVQGNGQSELVEILSGINPHYKGYMQINNIEAKPGDSPRKRREMGLGHIPEDRMQMGFAPHGSIQDNFIMSTYNKPGNTRFGLISRKMIIQQLKNSIKEFNIKVSNISDNGDTLSGGNIQKLIVAREYNLNPRVLIAAQPTNGVDIGATEFIHQQLLKIRSEGKAVILVSNELSEILSLSDRIIVMYRGKVIGVVDAQDATEEKIGLLMAGIANNTKG